ncbi:hypothetical protein ACWCQ0_52625 [Streptomyces massasporeus]
MAFVERRKPDPGTYRLRAAASYPLPREAKRSWWQWPKNCSSST